MLEANGGTIEPKEGELHASLLGTSFHLRISEKVNRKDYVETLEEERAKERYWKLPDRTRGKYPHTPATTTFLRAC